MLNWIDGMRLLCLHNYIQHRWRKARKNEDAGKKYCARGCGASMPIRKRQSKETA